MRLTLVTRETCCAFANNEIELLLKVAAIFDGIQSMVLPIAALPYRASEHVNVYNRARARIQQPRR